MSESRRVPVSQKGEETRERILKNASSLFFHQGYHPTSIVQIARKVSISPAAVYQYFRSKEQIYQVILGSFQEDFLSTIQNGSLGSLTERLGKWVSDMLERVWNYRALFRVFRGAEFVQFEAAKEFHDRWVNTVIQSFFPKTDPLTGEVGSWYLMGPLLYVATKWIVWNASPVPEIYQRGLVDFFLNGISPSKYSCQLKNDSFSFSSNQKATPEVSREELVSHQNRGTQTRQKILDSAEQLFGERGYYHTHIHEIASQSGCGVGTVYLYFPSKLEILRELVEEVNHQLRRYIRSKTESISDRRDAELVGYKAFLEFFLHHWRMYGIVRESEFVDHSITSAYYGRLEEGYRKVLPLARDREQIRMMDPQLLAWCLMGLGHTMGESLLIFRDPDPSSFQGYLRGLSHFLYHGIANYSTQFGSRNNP